jgi:hypothetical protein
MSFNFGNAKINQNFTATFGNVTNYNNMFAGENEDETPWVPLHVEKGFKSEESTVSLFRGWNINHLGMGMGKKVSAQMVEVMNGLNSLVPGGTFILDPLTAKNLKRQEGFNTKEEFRQWLLSRIKKPAGPFASRPVAIHLVVVGGEWNPMFTTTDFTYTQTVSIDKWIPKSGIRFDKKPIRMPAPVTCKNGACGIG